MYNGKWYRIKNKRIAIFFLTLVLIIVFAIPVHGADVHIIKKELNPVPVEPGEDMVLEVY
ncbi:MAG: hypothetical protein K8R25_04680 [Methanosarcinales archaeon]|nr:hypothetical protein [Methanosarcinales archaeon]